MINRVILVGRLSKDPVLRKTGTGASVVSFTVACDRKIKVEGQPTADFINAVAWNKVADLVGQYLHKGSLAGVEGRIQTRSYDDQSGKRVFITEVVADSVQFLDNKGQAQTQTDNKSFNTATGSSQSYQQNSFTATANGDYASDTLDIQSDMLPF